MKALAKAISKQNKPKKRVHGIDWRANGFMGERAGG
jgi:hypothetical protein